MKILMVHPHDIYSVVEPWTSRIVNIAKEFIKKGHKVKLVYFPLPKKERGIVLKRIKEFETIQFNRRKWNIFKNIVRMYKLAKWSDIIHFQKCFSIASLPALFAAHLRNKPIHYDWDDWEYQIYQFSPPSKLYGNYLNILEKILPKLVDTISVSSKALHDLALNLGINEEKLFESHVGADLKKFHPNIDSNVKKEYQIKNSLILYIGQLHGAQYAELFIKAAKIILEKRKDATFMIVGGGADLDRLKNISEKLTDNRVIFTGPVEHNKVPEFISAADIAVACFVDNEQVRCKSPLKIVEYLASGKAIVASDVGEVSKMIGNAGILTKPGDIVSLAKGIKRLLDNSKLRKELEKRARKRTEEEYNWTITANNLLKAYNTALKEY